MKAQRILSSVIACTIAAAPLAASAEPVRAATPSVVVSAGAPASASNGEANSYAQREKQSTAPTAFEGGGAYIYIGSTAAVVILVVLLVLLL